MSKHINMHQALKKKENPVYENEAIGRSIGGLTCKLHCVIDGLDNPIDFRLTGGEVHDSVCANGLLDGKSVDFVLADKAYDSDKILEKIKEIGATAVIPPKSNRKIPRKYDKHYYKERNLVERFFCSLKQIRGIATRYCKRGEYFPEAVKLASCIILMC